MALNQGVDNEFRERRLNLEIQPSPFFALQAWVQAFLNSFELPANTDCSSVRQAKTPESFPILAA
jgi:hypothetical protein